MLYQVKLHENPAFSDLGPGDFACACFFLQRDRMNLEELGGLLKGEGAHGLASMCWLCQRMNHLHPLRGRQLFRPRAASTRLELLRRHRMQQGGQSSRLAL